MNSIGLRVLKIDRVKETTDDYQLQVLLYAKGQTQNAPRSISSLHRLTVQFKNDDDIIAAKIVRRWEVESLTSRGAKKSMFADVTKPTGLDKVDLPDNWKLPPLSQPDTYTSQIAVADFDQDGYLDIAIATLQGQQYVLRSVDGISYEDVTEEMGLSKTRFASKTTLATWIDYDNDNYPDLLLGKNLYHNEAGRHFKLRTWAAGLKFNSATLGAVVADYDCDGWLDFYVLNHYGQRDPNKKVSFVGDDDSSGAPNQLWRNLGNGKFKDVTEEAGVVGGSRHSFSASWMHANDDHFPDLYVVNDFGRNLFFINRGNGTFDDIAETAEVGDYANSMGVASGDLDNNGTTEIYVANMFSKMGRRIIAHVSDADYDSEIYDGIRGACAGSHLYTPEKSASDKGTNVGSAKTDPCYEEISKAKNVNAIGWAYAPVFADFDADGLLDIYATSGFISVDRGKPDG
ncbi:MAG: VCBS repeat-containing protein [Pirellulaceae bacterium]